MEVITIVTILITWIIPTFLPNYQEEFENVMSPSQVQRGRSIIHSIFTMPLLAIGCMYLLKHLFGEGGVVFVFSAHTFILLLFFVSTIYWRGQFKAAKKESLIKAKHFFNQFPWDKVEHAYGQATDSPEYLTNLINEKDEFLDAREDAINDFLYARPWHQYTVYSSTPYAVKCVHYIIENVDVSSFYVGKSPLLFDLIHFVNLCTHAAQNDEKLKNTIIDGKEIYKRFQNHPNQGVREKSAELVVFCVSR
ncbi:hypothetical protein OS175_07105 [Marinicella sp. S1101]|uniref:hypothetical protein n=1 Tax=Marinicella marina TaxID=2996016 RepID=UPI0022609774|nr:hypothetical protein [Marinicella marina]MCX7553642.1 hypothetical protein [Marinicella marina]MDJ1140266.1 hypothetical protein [Marinicella marina]